MSIFRGMNSVSGVRTQLFVQAGVTALFALTARSGLDGWTMLTLVVAAGAVFLGISVQPQPVWRQAVLGFEAAAVAYGALALVSAHYVPGTIIAVATLVRIGSADGAAAFVGAPSAPLWAPPAGAPVPGYAVPQQPPAYGFPPPPAGPPAFAAPAPAASPAYAAAPAPLPAAMPAAVPAAPPAPVPAAGFAPLHEPVAPPMSAPVLVPPVPELPVAAAPAPVAAPAPAAAPAEPAPVVPRAAAMTILPGR